MESSSLATATRADLGCARVDHGLEGAYRRYNRLTNCSKEELDRERSGHLVIADSSYRHDPEIGRTLRS